MGNVASEVAHAAERAVFPPLLIEDEILDREKHELQQIQDEIKHEGDSYKQLVQNAAGKMKQVHDKQFGMVFMVGAVNGLIDNGDLAKMPAFDEMSSRVYKIAEVAVGLASAVLSIVAMVVPGGEIFALIIPVIADVINEVIEITRLEEAIKTAHSNLGKLQGAVNANTPMLNDAMARADQMLSDLSAFEANIFKTLGVSSWDGVKDLGEHTVNFQRDIDDLSTVQTRGDAEKLAGRLRKEEGDLLLSIFDQRQTLREQLSKITAVRAEVMHTMMLPAGADTVTVDVARGDRPQATQSAEDIKALHFAELLFTSARVLVQQFDHSLSRQLCGKFVVSAGTSMSTEFEALRSTDFTSENAKVETHLSALISGMGSLLPIVDMFKPTSEAWPPVLRDIVPYGVRANAADAVTERTSLMAAAWPWLTSKLRDEEALSVTWTDISSRMDGTYQHLISKLRAKENEWAQYTNMENVGRELCNDLQALGTSLSGDEVYGIVVKHVNDPQECQAIMDVFKMRVSFLDSAQAAGLLAS